MDPGKTVLAQGNSFRNLRKLIEGAENVFSISRKFFIDLGKVVLAQGFFFKLKKLILGFFSNSENLSKEI